MNRDVGRGPDAVQQEPSSNYLIYLFFFSAIFIGLLPYLLPYGGSLLRLSKRGTVEKPKVQASGRSEPYSPYMYTSLSTSSLASRSHNYGNDRDEIEMFIVDLQRAIQIERERTFQLENEIRILHLSERYLKERVQKLEDRELENRRSFAARSAPVEHLMERTVNVQNKQENMDGFLQELLRMLHAEREKVSSLSLEVKILRMSESALVDRIKKLEDKFNEFLTKGRQREDFGNEYEQRNLREF